jgi:hypothetical protein
MNQAPTRVMIGGRPQSAGAEGVTGFDSEWFIRRSVPRKATMISLTMRCDELSAESSQRDFQLAA